MVGRCGLVLGHMKVLLKIENRSTENLYDPYGSMVPKINVTTIFNFMVHHIHLTSWYISWLGGVRMCGPLLGQGFEQLRNRNTDRQILVLRY